MEIKLRSFESQILYFNGLYKLPIASKPSLEAVGNAAERLEKFKDILIEEVNEVDDIIQSLKTDTYQDGKPLEVLTNLSDWLGDMVVYITSEAAKFGIPLAEVQSIIMQSNFSKLDKDGNPIYDERGKIQKGPFYWKPEPRIKQLLEEKMNGG